MNDFVLNPNKPPIIIGSGITGATISMMKPEFSLYDKARYPGGRVSTKQLQENGIRFDIGATMFRDQMEIDWLGKVTQYNLFEIWNTNGVKIETKSIYDKNHHFPIEGMESIVKGMLKDKSSHQSHTLKSLKKKDNHSWECIFYSNANKQFVSVDTSQVIFTLPIPQILELFTNSEATIEFKRWKDFLETYNDYRKTLVCLFSWDHWKPDLNSLGLNLENQIPITTSLQRGEDWEYQSWEHIKYQNDSSKGANLLVQFSSLFSETHFEYWMDQEKKPTPFYQEMLTTGVKEKWDTPSPDGIFLHRWKYAQAQMPLLGREGALKLDSEEFSEWKTLCKETGIMVLGDWMFGSKIERIIGGVHFLIHNGIL
ncbi:NAD(P)-binding protein [Leptospira sp. WS39.C2]